MARTLWLSTLLTCTSAFATSADQMEQEQTDASDTKPVSNDSARQHVKKEIERIQVLGRHFLPEHQGSDGAFTLNRGFIDDLLQGNGNITDMLVFLPGVQGSEGALDVNQQQEIRSKLISISGAQPWQNQFIFDGVSNSSLIDPANSNRSANAINDVQGHPEAMFINQELVGAVTVYDSNVPARYGNLLGGVVDVEPRSAVSTPRLTLNYRTSQSQLNQYRLIDNLQENDDDGGIERDPPRKPNFDKESLSISTRWNITDKQSFVLSAARTTSTISEVSLLETVSTARESWSTSAQWTIDDVLLDRITVSGSYSPYRSDVILADVKDSEFSLRGGGYRFGINAQQEMFAWQTDWRLSWSHSENSRTAPQFYLPWYRAAGKNWGLNVGEVPFSIEGGYGDLDKEQEALQLSTAWDKGLGKLLGAEHALEWGADTSRSDISRSRPQASVIYSSPYRDSNIDCQATTLDCVEQSYRISLEALAEELGGEIDFSNPEHIFAFQENLLARGQYFRYRRIYPQDNIQVSLQQSSAYTELSSVWEKLRTDVGLRIDHDDFLNNLDISWRSRASYSVTDTTTLFTGANRYYAANLTAYAIREAQRPYIIQYRPVAQGVIGSWLDATSSDRFRYRFENVKTPYSDELTFGVRQALFGGFFSARWVRRENKDLITRGPTERFDGYTYIYQTNEGESQHNRYSISYYREWQNHGITFNVSHSENQTTAGSYDTAVEDVPDDELVFLSTQMNGNTEYTLMSFDDLTRRQDDFSRPVTANLVLRSHWNDQFSTTFTLSFVGEYESAFNTNLQREIEVTDGICESCEPVNVAYPVFEYVERPARTLLGAKMSWRPMQYPRVAVTLEISNLLNSRTHQIGRNQIGFETGRDIWLGVGLQW
ncbi:hypothetical protein [Aliidiomarina shirensis]|nr:hypothetical protein [Aliidiomarina shirensis]